MRIYRGDVFQMGQVIPSAPAEEQPPLLYITRVVGEMVEGIREDRVRLILPISTVKSFGYRGNLIAKDLARIEKRAK